MSSISTLANSSLGVKKTHLMGRKMKAFGIILKTFLKAMFPRISYKTYFSLGRAHLEDPTYYADIISKLGDGVEARQLGIAFELTGRKLRHE